MQRFTFPVFLRSHWIWLLLAGLAAVPLVILALLYWWLLPNLPAYKNDVARLLSSATGYTITLDKLDGEWGGARPRFVLEGVRVLQGQRPLLYFSRLDGRFGWRSMLALEPRFHSLTLEVPALTLRRAQDGMIYVGGLQVDPDSPNPSFGDWLLKQGEVRLDGATIAWVDDTLGSPPLVLRNVHFELQNLFTRHAFELAATPPAWLSRPLRVQGVLHGKQLSSLADWYGNVELDIPALEMSAWRPWLPAKYAAVRGHGSVEGTFSVYQGALSAAALKLDLADIEMKLPRLDAPLSLTRVVGEAGWMRELSASGTTDTVYVRRLNLKGRNGVRFEPFDFSWSQRPSGHTVSVRNLPLNSLDTLSGELPITVSQREALRALAPKGRLDQLRLDWQNPAGAPLALPSVFKIDARFTGLGWAARGARPGAVNLSGSLSGDEEKGSYQISGSQAGFDVPEIFADPALRFDKMNLRGGWKRVKSRGGENYLIEIAEAFLSNPDLTANVHGSYRLDAKGPGTADLHGKVLRATGPRVQRYLPAVIGVDTHEWLRSSILRGDVSDASFVLQGDLSRFPFKSASEGIFQLRAHLRGVQLRYASDYPMIEDIDGELLMDGVRLEVQSNKARISGAQLHKVKVAIPDYETTDELLEVSGEAEGSASEFIRFVNFSPISDTLEGMTEEMTALGDMRLKLNMKIPLRRSQDTKARGRLILTDNTIFPAPDLPRIEQMNGVLDFTERSISVPNMTARILGGGASASATTENNQVRVRGRGVFQATALEAWLGKEVAGRLNGQSDWRGEIYLGSGKNRLRFESSLVGLESKLPAPIKKTAARNMPFVFEQQAMSGGGKWFSLQYGSVASAVWTSLPTASGFRLERGELRFGDKARLPVESGLQIQGYVNTFDLGGWVDILPDGQATQPGVNISGINLTLASLDFLNRRFRDISINAKLRGTLLRATVAGKEMAGNLTYRRSGEGPTRLSAQFKHFILPDANPQPPAAAEVQSVQLEASNIPAFDLQVEELTLGDQPMGRLDVIAHGVANGMVIDRLNLAHADSVIRMNGLWKDTGKGETRMKANVEIKNIGQMLDRFGYANAVKRGAAQVEGEIAWLGSPADFAFRTLEGTLRLNARNGQFLKVNPGAGKLLGIASLQSLPRRITLDFRDVFSEGFAFDEISSTMQLARGDLYTHDFLMKGPAATVRMSGVAHLQNETVKLRAKVIPKLSEGVAVAGGLLGGPVAGLGALVVQKVLKDPFEEAISFEYLIDGEWENPTVTRLSKSKPEKEPEP